VTEGDWIVLVRSMLHLERRRVKALAALNFGGPPDSEKALPKGRVESLDSTAGSYSEEKGERGELRLLVLYTM